MKGVYVQKNKRTGMFVARVRPRKKILHVGHFKCELRAHKECETIMKTGIWPVKMELKRRMRCESATASDTALNLLADTAVQYETITPSFMKNSHGAVQQCSRICHTHINVLKSDIKGANFAETTTLKELAILKKQLNTIQQTRQTMHVKKTYWKGVLESLADDISQA